MSVSQARYVCSERAFGQSLIKGLVIVRNSRRNAGLFGPDHGQRRRQDNTSSLASGSTLTTLIVASKARVIVRFRVQIPDGLPAGPGRLF
jgi:hypothetical protein